jgi:hypothetical protein
MSNHNKDIRKKIDAVIKNERSMGKIKEEAKAQCTHTLNGEPAFIPSNEPRTDGKLKYICKLCQKPITITNISEDELQKACDIIDRAVDIIKITAGSINNDEDSKMIEKMSKLQYRVRNDLIPTYRASTKRNNKKDRKHNNNQHEAAWGRPQVSGR